MSEEATHAVFNPRHEADTFFGAIGEDPDLAGFFDFLKPKGVELVSLGSKPMLGPGAAGEDVRLLQTLLQEAGVKVTVTGVYDLATGEAVNAFRVRSGLVSSVKMDTPVWQALEVFINTARQQKAKASAANMQAQAMNVLSTASTMIPTQAGAQTPAPISPAAPAEPPGWGAKEYVMLGGGVLLLGALGFAIYKSFSE